VTATANAVAVRRINITTVISRRSGTVLVIGRPSSTSQIAFEARMKAPMYAEADQIAPAIPMMNRMLAPPRLSVSPCRALARILWAGPGAKPPRLSRSGLVAESPIRPRIETSAIRAGKIERTP
jgi:hypothetical protein